MHTVAVQLSPLLAAEKSKVPFYIAGGVLVAWALILSLALGLRKPTFPGDPRGERGVIAITVVLVLAAITAAVATSGGSEPAKPAGAYGKTFFFAPNPVVSSSASSTQASAPAAATPAGTSPAATTPAATTTAATTTAATTTAATTTAAAPTPSSAAAGGTTLKLEANPGGLLSYNTKQLSAKAGAVTIAFTNSSPVEHNVTVAQGGSVLGATPTFTGGSKTLALNLKPGTYTFFCSVPGHRQAGMEGTLKVL